MKSKLLTSLVLLLGFSLSASAAHAAVLRVVTVQPKDMTAYIKELERGQAVLKKLGSPAVIRAWNARFAGDKAGMLVVTVEYPDLAAMASDEQKVVEDGEYREWYQSLLKMRHLVSESLYEESKSQR